MRCFATDTKKKASLAETESSQVVQLVDWLNSLVGFQPQATQQFLMMNCELMF